LLLLSDFTFYAQFDRSGGKKEKKGRNTKRRRNGIQYAHIFFVFLFLFLVQFK